ncbi:MAG: N-methyl-L-tryptophan oxidase [Planctomycetaceae bacterium]|nr:N-methyl-L-tryptophan oxidase [Planctomycetaceae bacterium]
MVETYDCIVLGLGGIGSATVNALSRRGLRTLGLEQHGPAHDYGSSHGESRIIRTAYFEHPDYVPLLREAFTGWRALEAESGQTLLDSTGLFLSGPRDGEAISGTLRAAADHDLPLDVLSLSEARDRFPGFRFTGDDCVLFERDAGSLQVEACVQANLTRAACRGAVLRFHEPAAEWSADSRGIRVCTDRGEYRAGRLIVTAGPWAERVLRTLGIKLRVWRKVQLWFPLRPDAGPSIPCFFFEEAQGAFYGLPSRGGGLIKVAEHSGGEEVEDPSLVDGKLHERDVGRVREFVVERIPLAVADVVRHSVCMYTMSPDGHFLLDQHPDHSTVWYAAGLSGHGFKFCGVLGNALADYATNGRTALPVEFLRSSRLTSTSGERVVE